MPPHSHICGNIQLIENLSQQKRHDEAAEILASGKTLEEITPVDGEIGVGY